MKLEFLDATGNGKFPDASPAAVVRISGFNEEERSALINAIRKTVIEKQMPLELHKLPFIVFINCTVTLRPGHDDKGLLHKGPGNDYDCILSGKAYIDMAEKIELAGDAYNWLTPGDYLDEPAFLISRYGSW